MTINELYPDLKADTIEELLKKRDAIKQLIDLGYGLQPELSRVNAAIDAEVERLR